MFAPKRRQQTQNTVPRQFAFSLAGTRTGFLLTGHGGECANADLVVLARLATGAETIPARPRGQWYVAAVWFSPSGTPFASLVRAPTPCSPASRVVVRPGVYRRAGGRWVRTGSGIIDAAYFPGGWRAVLSGRVISNSLGIGGFSHARLTVSHGTSKATIPGVTVFGWVP